MLKDKIEAFANENKFTFVYGTLQYANLVDNPCGSKTLSLDPIERSTIMNKGFEQATNFNAKIYMLVPAEEKETLAKDRYNDRYKKNIKPLLEEAEKLKLYISRCGGFAINSFSTTEISSLLDTYNDGIMINLSALKW